MISRTLLPTSLREEILRHAGGAYPEEACGFLVGRQNGSDRRVERVLRARNRVGSEAGRRYLIPADELRSLELQLQGGETEVVGFYHSHPDHPARPSEFDRDHAWPWYVYIVAMSTPQGSEAMRAYELDPETREFAEVPLDDAPAAKAAQPDGGVSESS